MTTEERIEERQYHNMHELREHKGQKLKEITLVVRKNKQLVAEKLTKEKGKILQITKKGILRYELNGNNKREQALIYYKKRHSYLLLMQNNKTHDYTAYAVYGFMDAALDDKTPTGDNTSIK